MNDSFIDITGQRFGKYTAIEFVSPRRWRCVCDCGRESLLRSRDLRKSLATKCRACRKINMIGVQVGDWTVLGEAATVRGSPVKWKCQCKCGATRDIAGAVLRSGRSTKCVKCRHDSRKKPNGESAFHDVYSAYRRQARNRGLEFSITKQQFVELTQSNCHYTGLPPSSIKKTPGGVFVYNGIDRIDNAVGYTYENCVPCAGAVNMMKRGMAYHDFINLCNQIAAHTNNRQPLPHADAQTCSFANDLGGDEVVH